MSSPDLVQLTVLLVATAAAALLGGLLGAVVALAAARSQMRLLQEELQHHMASGADPEGRIPRLIEARKAYLIPLREALSRWITGVRDALAAVEAAHDAETPPAQRAHARQRLDAAAAHVLTASDDLDALRGQTADKDLDDVLEALAAVRPELDAQVKALARLVDVPPLEEHDPFDDVFRRYRVMMDRFQGIVLTTNRRIDGLLAGDGADAAFA